MIRPTGEVKLSNFELLTKEFFMLLVILSNDIKFMRENIQILPQNTIVTIVLYMIQLLCVIRGK